MYNLILVLCALWCITTHSQEAAALPKRLPHVLIVMGSVRQGRTAEQIARAIVNSADANTIDLEIVDLKEINLPVISGHESVEDNTHVIQWSKKVTTADGVIFLTPNYNEGYSGVIKNAIDALSHEWQDKVVGVVAYTGGYDGGKKPADYLLAVLQTLHMKPLLDSIVLIPFADGAVNDLNMFKKQRNQDAVTSLLTTIVKVVS
ncbi:FMN reductase [Candidatus Dependentiae bacterium Noda2021]|nr:FMN reductase [Candidatus Dependentiae bacterium Noda2021]